MGYENLRSAKEYPLYRIPEHSYEINRDGYTEIVDTFELNWDLCFHSSFDWLMPVVHKITDISRFKSIDECTPEQWQYYKSISSLPISSEIHHIWFAVVRFIQWYNTQKP